MVARSSLIDFWRDERGSEMVEQVAVLGFVVLPMLVALLQMVNWTLRYFSEAWQDLAER